jgi:hypothetical protein
MARPTISRSGLRDAIMRIPEGFIHVSMLVHRFRGLSAAHLREYLSEQIDAYGEFVYDSARITPGQIDQMKIWARPSLPKLSPDGPAYGETIADTLALRETQRSYLSAAEAEIVSAMADHDGWADLSELTFDAGAVKSLEQSGWLQRVNQIAYDPLRLSSTTASELLHRIRITHASDQLREYLLQHDGATAPQADVVAMLGDETVRELLMHGGFSRFSIPLSMPPFTMTWIRLKDGDFAAAQEAAFAAVQVTEDEWKHFAGLVGPMLRPGAKPGSTWREAALACTYTLNGAAKRLEVEPDTLERASARGLLNVYADPEQVERISVQDVEAILTDEARAESIFGLQGVRARDIALVLDVPYMRLMRWMRRESMQRSRVLWEDVRGKWKLPDTYRAFLEILHGRIRERENAREAKRAEERAVLESERQRRSELRERLVASFPTWQHQGRTDQQIVLHVGPPNSGKTYDALNALADVTSGWYLAPLRLLAFEVFERLNQMGVRCNLLTGEERIPVDGAQITAATIEMFNPMRSGDCVVIDEAQMLSDADRGWAWTRALMEAQAPDIQVLAPPTARALVEKMAQAAAIPLSVVQHERLAPIQVADQPWKLKDLPPRTILVAFSRQAVLELKTALEASKRTVSVVYGNLPPEVRRKQADRFASGQTEICIATDAVGMGLNLPADNVCFYEVRKFDGRGVRLLSPGEVQQIGGRAGRFGLSEAGVIGALRREDLAQVRRLFNATAAQLTHARVAPTVADLEMIPGSLAERLSEWAILKSIPDGLRGALEVAQLAERIELASMLSAEDESTLGLAAAYQLVNAPTRQNSRAYWEQCARAIVQGRELPMPPVSGAHVSDKTDLDRLEMYIAWADIYLWLSQRREFEQYGQNAEEVRYMRTEWSEAIDAALLRRVRVRRPSLQQE